MNKNVYLCLNKCVGDVRLMIARQRNLPRLALLLLITYDFLTQEARLCMFFDPVNGFVCLTFKQNKISYFTVMEISWSVIDSAVSDGKRTSDLL